MKSPAKLEGYRKHNRVDETEEILRKLKWMLWNTAGKTRFDYEECTMQNINHSIKRRKLDQWTNQFNKSMDSCVTRMTSWQHDPQAKWCRHYGDRQCRRYIKFFL